MQSGNSGIEVSMIPQRHDPTQKTENSGEDVDAVAVFPSRADVETLIEHLYSIGVQPDAIRLSGTDPTSALEEGTRESNHFASFWEWLIGEETTSAGNAERSAYEAALSVGHALLAVRLPAALKATAIELIEDAHPLDIELTDLAKPDEGAPPAGASSSLVTRSRLWLRKRLLSAAEVITPEVK